MAVILERDLNDVDEAISTVLAILDENADNVAALEMLASLYERKGAVPERLEVLERRLQLATATEARVEILRGMAAAAGRAAGSAAGRARPLARGAGPASPAIRWLWSGWRPTWPTGRTRSAWRPPRCWSRSTRRPASGPS